MGNIPWSEADVAKLRKLAAKGMTSREIAKELGERYTRNSVIGKTQRMGIWLGRSKTSEPEQLIETELEPVVEPAPIPTATIHYLRVTPRLRVLTETPQESTGNRTFLMGLTSKSCRYPVSGDGERTLFCGDPTERGSWCSDHRKRVFVPKPGVQRDGEKIKLREESDGFLPNPRTGSFSFGSKTK